jgi:dolichyl-diphosphooligosaccharide--protein glycosyltransferase
MKRNLFYFIILFLVFVFAVFLRTYFSFDRFFSDPLKYSSDDGIYHMRLVENELLGNHFPHRIYFDPYTNFPHGTYEYFAPLYDQLLAAIIWIAGLGRPSLELINKIAPFYPVFLGGLMVVLAYFIARSVWGRKAGLLSALLMAVFPPFLYKSLIGATDHHVMEILLSSLTMMFLLFSLKVRKERTENPKRPLIERIKQELCCQKSFWVFSFLTGVSLGLYFLSWSGALLFLFIIFAFICCYYLSEYVFFGRSHYWILSMGILCFLITLLMISPFFKHPDLFRSYMYNIQHLEAIFFGVLGFLSLAVAAAIIKEKRLSRIFIFSPAVVLVLLVVLLKLLSPDLFLGLWNSVRAVNTGVVNNALARELISEMAPLKWAKAFHDFSTIIYLFVIGFFFLVYDFIKNKKPEYLLFIIWTAVIFLITGIIPYFGQQRFVGYLSVNVALLSSFAVVKILRFARRGLDLLEIESFSKETRSFVTIGSILLIFNVVFLIFFPFPFNLVNSFPTNLPQIIGVVRDTAKDGLIVQSEDMYETMKWIRENTPDPGVDYYALYKEPGVNKETGKINSYSYPETSYGILAVWDIGHMITYYAHRMPVANPFQQGIGKRDGDKTEPGEATFFIENDEQKAVGYLDQLRVRYVITNYHEAIPDGGFKQKVKWVQGSLEGYVAKESDEEPSKFDNSMIARLHVLDGNGETTTREVNGKRIVFPVKPLDHFRLIYESKERVILSADRPEDDIRAVKVFEYVKGAKIIGRAGFVSKVAVSTDITTNQGRKFTYKKDIEVKNGQFEFIVPYSTYGEVGWLSGQTRFSVFAEPYKLTVGDKEVVIDVFEQDVLEGRTIEIK